MKVVLTVRHSRRWLRTDKGQPEVFTHSSPNGHASVPRRSPSGAGLHRPLGRREVGGAGDFVALEVEDPGGALLQPGVPADEASPGEGLEQLADHVTVGAQHRRLAGELLDQATGFGQWRALGELVGQVDGETETLAEWLDGLAAAHVRAADHPRDATVGEQITERVGLATPGLGEGTQVIGTGHVASAVLVAGLADRGTELAAQTGLFFYLPERGVLVPFVSVGLALREAPVVVAGPVHERDLVTGAEPSSDPGPSRERSKDDATRGAHRGLARLAAGLGPAHSHWWCFLRRARCHAAGHARLAASAVSCSRATSSPATNAACPSRTCVAAVRSHAAATTPSWCSPRTSWTSVSARAKFRAGLPKAGSTASAAYRACLARRRTACSSSSVGSSGSDATV